MNAAPERWEYNARRARDCLQARQWDLALWYICRIRDVQQRVTVLHELQQARQDTPDQPPGPDAPESA